MKLQTQQLAGLSVSLDKLVYEKCPDHLLTHTPHTFIYFLTILNLSDRTIKILGRKWVLKFSTGEVLVVEGDGIVGKTPILASGEHFSYNSFHATKTNAEVIGTFYGIDELNNLIHILIPIFKLNIPK